MRQAAGSRLRHLRAHLCLQCIGGCLGRQVPQKLALLAQFIQQVAVLRILRELLLQRQSVGGTKLTIQIGDQLRFEVFQFIGHRYHVGVM